MSGAVSPNTQAILLLTAPLLGPTKGTRDEVLKPSEYQKLVRQLLELHQEPADLLSTNAEELIKGCRAIVNPDRLKQLLERGFRLSQAVERWHSRAIWVISRADESYPRTLKVRMRNKAPALLYGSGDVNILSAGGLAVVGSRKVTEELVRYADEVGRVVARARKVLISGGAQGIDQAAMRGASEEGGRVAGVLAEDLERSTLQRENRDALLAGRLVLVSEYDPNSRFTVAHAMDRNKLIYAFADAALVANSDLRKGGTWAGAIEQLERLRFCSVYVRSTGEPNEALEALRERGALPWPNPTDDVGLSSVLRAPAPAAGQLQLDATDPPPDNEIIDDISRPAETAEALQQHEGAQAAFRPLQIGTSSSLELFSHVRHLIVSMLSAPMSYSQVAASLDVRLDQARDWLERLVCDGTLRKRDDDTYLVEFKDLPEGVRPTNLAKRNA